MLKLTELSANRVATAPEIVPGKMVAGAVHYELPNAPGCFVHVLLTAKGVQVGAGDDQIAFPIEELVRLAMKHEPRLVPTLATEVKAHDDTFQSK